MKPPRWVLVGLPVWFVAGAASGYLHGGVAEALLRVLVAALTTFTVWHAWTVEAM